MDQIAPAFRAALDAAAGVNAAPPPRALCSQTVKSGTKVQPDVTQLEYGQKVSVSKNVVESASKQIRHC